MVFSNPLDSERRLKRYTGGGGGVDAEFALGAHI